MVLPVQLDQIQPQGNAPSPPKQFFFKLIKLINGLLYAGNTQVGTEVEKLSENR
jgi:hypothetical protein